MILMVIRMTVLYKNIKQLILNFMLKIFFTKDKFDIISSVYCHVFLNKLRFFLKIG